MPRKGKGKGKAESKDDGKGKSRVPSGPWRRLAPIDEDPFETIGLPSKGDGRLLNFKTQMWYYNQIISRILQFSTEAGDRHELLRRIESIDIRAVDDTPAGPFSRPRPGHSPLVTVKPRKIATTGHALTPVPPRAPTVSDSSAPSQSSSSSAAADAAAAESSSIGNQLIPAAGPSTQVMAAFQNPENTKLLEDALFGLRKLREGLVASQRADLFATQVYIFSIRLSIATKHPESYHPAILHLLRNIAVWNPMEDAEIKEMASYFMLDTACRRGDLAEAYFIKRDFKIENRKLDIVLKALATTNYIAWQKIKPQLDQHCLKLMSWADGDMRLHALKCIGRSYLYVDLEYLEYATDRKWDELKEKDNVGWELDGELNDVIIKKVRSKPTAAK